MTPHLYCEERGATDDESETAGGCVLSISDHLRDYGSLATDCMNAGGRFCGLMLRMVLLTPAIALLIVSWALFECARYCEEKKLEETNYGR